MLGKKVIHKHEITLSTKPQTLMLSVDAKVVLVGYQDHHLMLWEEHEHEADGIKQKVRRLFATYGTGAPIPGSAMHIQSIQNGPFVWHVYEVNPFSEVLP